MTRQATRQATRRPPLTAAVLRRWLEQAPPFHKSAVLVEAELLLGSLEAVYRLLDQANMATDLLEWPHNMSGPGGRATAPEAVAHTCEGGWA
jgi:hypothetical protein